MEIRFEKEVRLLKVRQRTYSPEQLYFMKKKCDELLEVGYIYSKPSLKWACAPLILPMEGPEIFRFTSISVRSTLKQRSRMAYASCRSDAGQDHRI